MTPDDQRKRKHAIGATTTKNRRFAYRRNDSFYNRVVRRLSEHSTKNGLQWNPFYVNPTGDLYVQWVGAVSLIVIYNLILVPARAVFWELQNSFLPWWFILDGLADLIYIFDMVIQSRTACREGGLMQTNTKVLLRRYIKSWKFVVDIISVLPLDFTFLIVGSVCSPKVPCQAICRLNRCIRFYRVREFSWKYEIKSNFSVAFRIFKLLIFILMLIHWNGCLYFCISYFRGFGSDEWVFGNLEGDLAKLAHQYSYSIYWSTMLLTNVGNVPEPQASFEYWVMVIEYLLGILLFATIIGNVGAAIINVHHDKMIFRKKLDNIKDYMKREGVDKSFQERVVKWFEFSWEQEKGLNEEEVLQVLPETQKREMAITVHLEMLKKVSIFRECEASFLRDLVLKLERVVIAPGEFICHRGDVGDAMFFIKEGRLHVLGCDDDSTIDILSDGCYFGELSLLNIAGNVSGNRRVSSVLSEGYSNLFRLGKADLWNTLEDYPNARIMLENRGKKVLGREGLLSDSTSTKNTQQNTNDTQTETLRNQSKSSTIEELEASGIEADESNDPEKCLISPQKSSAAKSWKPSVHGSDSSLTVVTKMSSRNPSTLLISTDSDSVGDIELKRLFPRSELDSLVSSRLPQSLLSSDMDLISTDGPDLIRLTEMLKTLQESQQKVQERLTEIEKYLHKLFLNKRYSV